MTDILPTSIVNETVRRYPETIGVFNAFGVDTCCGGGVSIDEAARREGVDPAQLLQALRDAVSVGVGRHA